MPKQTSPLQILANRRNAQKSTGPRTPEGKRRSARNAIRHGFYAKDFMLVTREQLRDRRRFQELAHQLRQDLRPEDEVEVALVVRIIAAAWHMHRVARFEAECAARIPSP